MSLYNRGMAFEKLNCINEAIDDYSRVLELDPSHVNAAYARAACHNRKGNYSQAIEDYSLALSKDKAKQVKQPGKSLGSPSMQRKGSFRLGVDEYVKQKEAQAREKLAASPGRGSSLGDSFRSVTPVQSPAPMASPASGVGGGGGGR